MGFLLLGIDSLIAGIAIGPMISRKIFIPLALLFGICDGAGFLLGSAFQWSMPTGLGKSLQTAILVALGVYWIVIALLSGRAATARQLASRWVWVLPAALSIDNITYGLVDGVPDHASVWQSAGEQALSSALLAVVGLAIGLGIAAAIPALRRRMSLANGICGAALIAAAGVLLAVG